MKKYLLALLLASCCPFAYGQIQRHFWGTALGVSGAEEVKQKVRGRGYVCTASEDNRRLSVFNYADPVTFANAVCSATSFSFYEDRCYQVKFTFAKPGQSDELSAFSKIEDAIASKYRKYLKTRKTKRTNRTVAHLPQSPRKTAPEAEVTTSLYSDGKTLLSVDEQTLTVTYTDRSLADKRAQMGRAELQETRTFLGCTLGTTTYAEAEQILRQKFGGTLEQKGRDYLEKIVPFAGSRYYARFSFHRGVLYQVSFRRRQSPDEPGFKELKKVLDKKLKKHCVTAKNGYAEYNNGQTRVTLQGNRNFGEDPERILLEYTDVNLWKLKECVNEEEI